MALWGDRVIGQMVPVHCLKCTCTALGLRGREVGYRGSRAFNWGGEESIEPPKTEGINQLLNEVWRRRRGKFF